MLELDRTLERISHCRAGALRQTGLLRLNEYRQGAQPGTL